MSYVPPSMFWPLPQDIQPERNYATGGLITGTLSSSIPSMSRVEFTESYDLTGVSTSLAKVWFNRNTERMTVRFKNGGLYSYDGVSGALFREFMAAPSFGKKFREVFRNTGGDTPEWPGEKHDEMSVTFGQVDVIVRPEDATPGLPWHFHYTTRAEGDVVIRAHSLEEAIRLFDEALPEAEAISVSINLSE